MMLLSRVSSALRTGSPYMVCGALLCSALVLVQGASNMTVQSAGKELVLFDFTRADASVSHWVEQSDVVRSVGMSKADLVLQKTQQFQRAVFFTLLNPQPNGAGFAGMRTFTTLDLSAHSKILLSCRGQGQNFGYKVVLRHRGLNDEPNPTYEQMFQAPKGEFGTVELPLKNFLPYYRGQQIKAIPLDTTNITSVELQMYGGVYLETKQSGVSSLEINRISAE